jgi:SAM-dependent methyltransferase
MSSASSLRAKAFGNDASGAPAAVSAAPPAAKAGVASKTAAADAASADAAGRPAAFKAKLRAWWHGTDVEEPEPANAEPAPPVSEAPTEEAPAEIQAPDAAAWSEVRVKAAEIVVGDDCRSPIGPDKAVEALRPLGLTSAKAVLDVSAGLGNAARAISAKYGCWVSGLESSAVLAAQAMTRSFEAGLANKVPIVHVDMENLQKPEKTFDCIYGREAFYTVHNKTPLLELLAGALKPNGEMVFTDYVLRSPNLRSAAVEEWLGGEPTTPHPWSSEEMIAQLRALRLDLRVTEDYTKQYRDLVVRRLELLVTKNELVASDPAQAEQLLHEVELWGRRIKALDSGDVQIYRFYGRKIGGEGKIKSMSNW